MSHSDPASLGLLGLLFGVCHTRLGVPLQKIFSVGAAGRVDGVADRGPAGQCAGQPENRRPECVCKQSNESVLLGLVVSKVPVGGHDDSDDDEADKGQVHPAVAVPDGNLESAPQRCPELAIPFVELGLL